MPEVISSEDFYGGYCLLFVFLLLMTFVSTELEEASRDSFVVQDLDVDTLRLMLDYLYLGKIK